MILTDRHEYVARFGALARALETDLKRLQLPSLAAVASSPHSRIKFDYDRSREVPLQLSTETGQPCSRWRHKFACQWIAKVEGAIEHGRIEILQALVPSASDRTRLSALYLRALDGRLLMQGPAYELVQRLPAWLRLEVTGAGGSVGFYFAPSARSVPSDDSTPELISAGELEEAARYARQQWSDFCAKAESWIADGGISRLVISGPIRDNTDTQAGDRRQSVRP